MDDLKRKVEAQFWVAYATRVFEFVKEISKEACYGCSHRKSNETDHNVCRLGVNERIKRFLKKADERIIREQIIADWKKLVYDISLPLSLEESEMLLSDSSWIDELFSQSDRHARLLRLLCEDDGEELENCLEDESIIAMGLGRGDDAGGALPKSCNQMESGTTCFSNEESKDDFMDFAKTLGGNVVEPRPYDQEMFPDPFHQSISLCKEISIQSVEESTSDSEVIAELLKEGETSPEEEFVQKWSENSVKEAYEIAQVSQRRVAKFKTVATDYSLKVKNVALNGVREVLCFLEALFDSVLIKISNGMLATDQVRFVMHSQQLSYPISLPFMPRNELTTTRIMFEIERVLQSNEKFSLDGSLHVNLIHVAMPSGGKGKIGRGGVNLQKRLHDKKCFIQIRNKDELCLPRAIVTAIARENNHKKWSSIRQGKEPQRSEALELLKRANLPLKRCGLEDVKKFQEVIPEYQIVVVSAEHFNRIVFKGPSAEKVIYLYFHDGHFEIITSMAAFLNRSYFCPTCLKGYDVEDPRHHRCPDKCCCCQRIGCTDRVNHWQHCDDCGRFFKDVTCYKNHKEKIGVAKSVCEMYKKCSKCGKVIDRTQRNPGDHKCGEFHCRICKTFVLRESHRCYMQPLKRKFCEDEEGEICSKKRKVSQRKDKEGKYFFFDFECVQETGTHVPNLVVVQDEKGHEEVFRGPNTRDDFCNWLFSGDLHGAVCIAHNLKGYDAYFILQYLYDNKILPNLILNGAKVMSIEIPEAKIKFIDSLNFLTMPLAKLPEAFGLSELSKGFFPHLFNTKENRLYIGEIPDVSFYDPDGMTPEERKKFLLWHADQKKRQVVFNMQEELLKYCRLDVNILRKCCVKFRSMILDLCSVDPFEECITIASLCNTIFRKLFLKQETIAIIPPDGYRPKEKQSILAHKWLAWESHTRGIRIEHSRNGGEKRVEPHYSLDGYHEKTNTAFEFDGCFFHGHNLCYPGYETNPRIGLTMNELYQKTLQKRKHLKEKGMNLVHIWECEFKKQVKEKEEMAEFVKGLSFGEEEPLNPRDSFFGGRVNATRLLVNAKGDEKIKYVDFTSLYPWVNKYGDYPVGHPTIITQDFGDIETYFGLVKCAMLPPRGLYHPVLPFKGNGKLLFSLCKTCALHNQKTPCNHSDEERALIGTWVTLEIALALKKGYKVLKIHEVWNFEKRTNELFKDYVNCFLKRKQEASGWPSWCQTEDDKKLYLQKYKEHEGIDLEHDAIKKNEADRSVWKQMLNNFWGKLGQRPNRPKVKVIDAPVEYFDLLTSCQVEITNCHLINDEVIEMHYFVKEGFVEASDRTNVVLAAFTTAQARIKLYDLLDRLGQRVVYYDTDSVIFTLKIDEWEPHIGDYLGELKNELDDGDHIVKFVSAGPKNYAYRTAAGKTCCKVRGIALNFRTSQDVNLESMLDLVSSSPSEEIDVITPHKIVRDQKTKAILSKREVKKYRFVYDKRVIQENFDTLPYGY